MTRDEALIIEIMRLAANELASAEDLLAVLTRSPRVCEPLSAAAVFARVTAGMAPARIGR
jgi:hypothetical protein